MTMEICSLFSHSHPYRPKDEWHAEKPQIVSKLKRLPLRDDGKPNENDKRKIFYSFVLCILQFSILLSSPSARQDERPRE